MKRQIRLNAFDMNCVGHQSPGLWAHPRDRSETYRELEYWKHLARTLERGCFDGLFLADMLGVYDVAIFTLTTVIVGRTEAEARAKHADYRNYIDHEASLALLFGWTGIDFSKYRLSDPLRHVQTEAMRSAVESFISADPNRVWTVGELAEHVGIGGRGPVLVGSPEQVADELQAWAGVDGFNVANAVTPESFEDFVDLVVPILQRRGVFKTDYRPGTLREKLFGAGQARLLPTHPGARFRFRPADG
ncbi:MAG: hypothetical protein AB7G15_08000 [Alphaproteobacteria bacterium]